MNPLQGSQIVMDELFERILEVKNRYRDPDGRTECETGSGDCGTGALCLVTGENRYTDSGQALLDNEDVRRSFLGG